MIEPKPEDFGLILINNKYKFIDRKKPTIEDYNLTKDDIKKINSKSIIIKAFNYPYLSSLYKRYFHYKNDLNTYSYDIQHSIQLYLRVKNEYNEAILNQERQKVRAEKEYLKKLEYEKKKQLYIKEKLFQEKLKQQKMKQIEYWTSLDGRSFEKEIALLFQKHGYDAELTPITNDHGVDINLTKDGEKIIVQCKRHSNPVGPHVVRDLYGTLIESKAKRAILVCTSGFTSGVYKYVIDKEIILMDMSDIISMANSK